MIMLKVLQTICYTVIPVCFSATSIAQQNGTGQAATATEAAAVLDLAELELIDPVGQPAAQVTARQSYQAGGKLTDVAQRLQALLKQAGCQELDGATFVDSYGSALYQKSGFTFSVTLSPAAEAGQTAVALTNHGNVPLTKLPIIEGSVEQFSTPIMAAYVNPAPVAEALDSYKRLLLDSGWEAFGETAVSFFVKQNAVLVQVMVSAAPALGGKTMIQLTSEQMSADLPAPPYTDTLQYSDSTGGMLFDSQRSQAEIIEFFKESLGKQGWQATTEQPLKIGFREHLIFRNPAREYLELDFQTVDGKTRTRLKYQTAKQFAAAESQAQEMLAQKQQARPAAMERRRTRPSSPSSCPPRPRSRSLPPIRSSYPSLPAPLRPPLRNGSPSTKN